VITVICRCGGRITSDELRALMDFGSQHAAHDDEDD
jgi:hypothetical protein